MAIPDYADPRAHRFYSLAFVGSKHGDAGSSTSMSWNSRHEKLQPTAVVSTGPLYQLCAYCGHRAKPIQPVDYGFDVSGYCCICKDAMDELEWRLTYTDLLEKQRLERVELESTAPKPSVKVIQTLMDHQHQARVKRLGEALPKENALEKEYGIVFQTPQSFFKSRHR